MEHLHAYYQSLYYSWVSNEIYVVEKPNASRNIDLLLVSASGLTVQVDRNGDICLIRLALDRCCTCGHFIEGWRCECKNKML